MFRTRRTADALALQAVMLRRHVIDLEAGEPADTARVADHDGRLVGVHVDLDGRVVTDDQCRVPLSLYFFPDIINRQLLAVDDELGAVTPTLRVRLDLLASRVVRRRQLLSAP